MSSFQNHRNSKDDNERYKRKRWAHLDIDNIEKLSNKELLNFFKPFGKVLDVLPEREASSTSTKLSSSTDRSSKRITHRQTSNYETSRKRFSTHERSNHNSHNDRIVGLEIDDRIYNPLLRFNSHQSCNDYQTPYITLTGPKNSNELVDCQIILVNACQRNYAE